MSPAPESGVMPLGAGRFAPSTSGPPHLGTLASALLVWLDARQRGVQAVLRLEDLDPQRARPAHAEAICSSLARLGLKFDATSHQSRHHRAHKAALYRLADMGLLYACGCDRRLIAERCAQGYDNHCRATGPLGKQHLETTTQAIRVRLPAGEVHPVDVGGTPLGQAPADVAGDPIVIRRDKSVAYVLASVVDDAHAHIGHIVRGADLAPLSATQVALMQLLKLAIPTFRHHPVLLDESGRKWSKSRFKAGGAQAATSNLSGPHIVGRLACILGLRQSPAPTTATALLEDFAWARVIACDTHVGAL